MMTMGGSSEDPGALPLGPDGKPLNLDFETGTLKDWTAAGDAFKGQPIQGDTVAKRRSDMKSNHQGQWWIGTYEVAKDMPKGTLTSMAFKVTAPWASFLVGGGQSHATRVEVVRKDNDAVIFSASGRDREEMRRVAVDLHAVAGKEIFIRIVDDASGGWGHINFDDFRFHSSEPKLPKEPQQSTVASLPADEVKFAGLSPQDAVKAITLPPGFKATLFAGEPDIVQPVAITIDDRGRIWVAEANTYPKKAPEGKGQDRILIFEDDGTGHFNKRTVFIEGLNLVSGLEVGFGGVWVGQAPELLFIPLLEGDKPGKPEVVLDGFGYHDTHETLNSFTWGPDGWLYGCHGVFTHSKVGKPGTPDEQRVPMNAAVWRYHPIQKKFEVWAEGGSNQWGLDWDDDGQAFITCCVIPHLYHVFPGGRYTRQAGQQFEPYTYQDIKTIADHVHWAGGGSPHAGNGRSSSAGGGHAHCGAMVYLGDNWPAEYRNSIYMNNIHGNRMNNDILEQTGSGYVGHHGKDFMLMNDRWARLINMKYGPDGGVYVIDWYDKQACHLPNPEAWDRTNGRIYKITYGETKPAHPDLAKLSSDELVQLQLSPNEWYVRHARRLLQERGDDKKIGTAIAAIASQNPSPQRRLRGMWTLFATGNLTESEWSARLSDKGPYIRAWAIELAAEDSKLIPSLSASARKLADDASPVVRLAVAGALPKLAADVQWDTAEALAAHSEDASDHNLPLMDWYAIDPLVPRDVDRAARLAVTAKIPLLREFIAQRLASLPNNPAGLDALVTALGTAPADLYGDLLKGMSQGLTGRRNVPMPRQWTTVVAKLRESSDGDVKQRVENLSTLFGDQAALGRLRKLAADSSADTTKRQEALQTLLDAKDAKLVPLLQSLLNDAKLRGLALRGLAAYDDPKTPGLILGLYPKLDGLEKLDALNTLASRPASARQLLEALKNKSIAKSDLTAPTIRNLSNLDDADINKWIAESWGTVRATAADKKKEIARLQGVLTPESIRRADATNGRALFTKTCAQCHTLFGSGARIGPDLTGSNRADINYLLENIVDPSAVIGKDYLLWLIRTKDGRAIDGIVKAENDQSITVATTTEYLTLPKSEIDKMKVSNVSMMPEGLLGGLTEKEVRDLVAYLRSPAQTPILATPENVKLFFDGKSTTFWDVDPALWHVENGEMIGHSDKGIKRNNFAFSQMVLADFRLVCQVKLVPNAANSGIQFRSQPRADGEAIGYQADIGKGWWGKLYEENGRGIVVKEGGEKYLKPDDWNLYEVLAVGDHVRLAINGHLCCDIHDPVGAKRGQTGLQIHSGGPTDVRYKDFELELNPKDEMKTVK
jgi:putative membrane-bound dehydrogenase-like protein